MRVLLFLQNVCFPSKTAVGGSGQSVGHRAQISQGKTLQIGTRPKGKCPKPVRAAFYTVFKPVHVGSKMRRFPTKTPWTALVLWALGRGTRALPMQRPSVIPSGGSPAVGV